MLLSIKIIISQLEFSQNIYEKFTKVDIDVLFFIILQH